ncbi:MAG: tetratricopeptide repeat protein [Bryobacterales bacterium]
MAAATKRIPLILALALSPALSFAQDGEVENNEDDQQLELLHRQSSTVNGKVTLDSGMPPPEPIAIELECESRAVSQVYTDRKGQFTAVLGEDSTASMLDASASTQLGPRAGQINSFPESRGANRCQLRIFLGGYQPVLFDLADEGALGLIDVGTIVLRRSSGAVGAAVSITSYEAPKSARKLFDKAFREAHKKRPNLQNAMRDLEAAVAEYPRYAAAWDLLGDCHLLTGSREGARKAYEGAVAADADYLPPYAPLIRMAALDARWEDAERLAGERLRLAPNGESAYFRAMALFELGALESAELAIDAAQRAADAHKLPQIALVQADIHAARGRFKQAAAQYALFLERVPQTPARPEIEARVEGWRRDGKLIAD